MIEIAEKLGEGLETPVLVEKEELEKVKEFLRYF